MPSGTGEAIACLLMPRLSALGAPVVVLAQYNRVHWTADAQARAKDLNAVRMVLACASEAGLVPIDLFEPLKPTIEARGIEALFRADHHTAEGNRLVAALIMQELARRRLLR